MHGGQRHLTERNIEMRCDICGQFMAEVDSYLVSGDSEDEEHKEFRCANGHTKSEVKKIRKPKAKPS